MADDDVVIRVGDARPSSVPRFELAGWTAVRVQRSCESFPSIFEVTATERFPGRNIDVSVRPGDPIQVAFTRGLGRDTVVTGYIDRVIPRLSAGTHELTIVGRSKCQDLVDCSHAWPTGQFNNMSVKTIAKNLAEPFGIRVSQVSGEERIIAQLVALNTETPYELIERIARVAALLVYDDTDGNLVLGRVGTERMASAIVEGKNVLRASISYSMDERFSEYRVRLLTFDTFRDAATNPAADIITVVPDAGVPRRRPKTIIAEAPQGLGLDYAKSRGEWEANRRFGRATQIVVTVDSWRDGAGDLWAPNKRVDVDLPGLKLGAPAREAPWVIATVVFRREERSGTTADLVIMPASAFEVFPVPLTPLLNTGPNQPGATAPGPNFP